MGKKFKRMSIILMCVCCIGCSSATDNQVHTDIDFVKEQFPQIEQIEKVEYVYKNIGNKREIGLQNIKFYGFIWIGNDFCNKIIHEYDWQETAVCRSIKTKLESPNKDFHFLYNYEFSHDGKYKSHSWGGDMFLDIEQKLLYFDCEW